MRIQHHYTKKIFHIKIFTKKIFFYFIKFGFKLTRISAEQKEPLCVCKSGPQQHSVD